MFLVLSRKSCRALGVAMVCGPLWTGFSLLAQSPVHAVASARAMAPPAPPDTGDFAAGPRTFAQYPTPLSCLVAAQRTAAEWHGTLAAQASLDAVRDLPTRDTLPAQVAAVARACGARFPVVGTEAKDLSDLFLVALYAGNDTLASAIVARRAALAPTAARRLHGLFWAIGEYLTASPARVAAAEALITQLDAHDSAAVLIRIRARDALLRVMQSEWIGPTSTEAQRQHWLTEEMQLLALVSQLPVPDLVADQGNVWDGGGAMLYGESRLLGRMAELWEPDSLETIVKQLQTVYRSPNVQQYLQGVSEGNFPGLVHTDEVFGNKGSDDEPPEIKDWPVGKLMLEFAPLGLETARYAGPQTLPRPGLPTPQISAAYWFPPAGVLDDSIQPVPGHVSLVVYSPDLMHCLSTVDNGVLGQMPSYADGANSQMEAQILSSTQVNGPICSDGAVRKLRDWVRQFGRAGLRIAVIADVHADSQGVLLSGEARPDSTARVFARYLQTFLGLPVAVGLEIVPVNVKVPPLNLDGRLFHDAASDFTKQFVDISDYEQYDYNWNKEFIVLTGHDGKMIHGEKSKLEDVENWYYELLISRALRAASIAGPSASPGSSVPPATGAR